MSDLESLSELYQKKLSAKDKQYLRWKTDLKRLKKESEKGVFANIKAQKLL